jgi:8-oxo-dGTP pyrophosphatase MutT (NUDIX family)
MIERLRWYLEATAYEVPPLKDLPAPAAVLIAITDHPESPEVVLTRRATHLNSHSGEVSLPGGKWEPEDPSLMYTALRETEEEIGLPPAQVEVLGGLPVFQTWKGISVVPYVGIIPQGLTFTPNYDELDAIFQVPLSFFMEDRRVRTDIFQREVGHLWSPAYDYNGYEIWGFTARLLVNFLNDVYEWNIQRENPAPTKDWL